MRRGVSHVRMSESGSAAKSVAQLLFRGFAEGSWEAAYAVSRAGPVLFTDPACYQYRPVTVAYLYFRARHCTTKTKGALKLPTSCEVGRLAVNLHVSEPSSTFLDSVKTCSARIHQTVCSCIITQLRNFRSVTSRGPADGSTPTFLFWTYKSAPVCRTFSI